MALSPTGSASKHAKKRCLERYGIRLNAKKYREINKGIKYKNPDIFKRHIKNVTNTRKIIEIVYERILMTVVFSTKTHTVVTFLPSDNYFNQD